MELFTRISGSPMANRSLHTATSQALADAGGRSARQLFRLRVPQAVLDNLWRIGAAEKQIVREAADDVVGETWVFYKSAVPYILQFLEKI